jgi:hypothetical protein
VWEIAHAVEGYLLSKGAKRKGKQLDKGSLDRLKTMLEKQKEKEKRDRSIRASSTHQG